MTNILKLFKWQCTGFFAFTLTTLLLYICIDILKFGMKFSTLVTAETVTLIRFLLLHRWVFGRCEFTLKDLINYHIANSIAFSAWLVVINLLVSAGVNYLVANILTVLVTTTINLITNFKWVWKEEWRERKPLQKDY